MTDERKIYPPMDEVPLSYKPKMSQADPNSMPMPQAAPYPAPQAPPYSMPQAAPYPTNQAPPYPTAQTAPYPTAETAPYPTPQAPPYPGPHVGQLPLGPTPSTMTCPSCGSSIVTCVRVEPSMMTHLMALALCFLCICFTCVPYCVDACQDANHYCPSCNVYLGTYKR